MNVSESYKDYVVDQLQSLGPVFAKKMFGGYGLFLDGVIFGVIANDEFYLKADDSTRPKYLKMGMKPFNPFEEESHSMTYFEVPIVVLENKYELENWAGESLMISQNTAKKRKIAFEADKRAGYGAGAPQGFGT